MGRYMCSFDSTVNCMKSKYKSGISKENLTSGIETCKCKNIHQISEIWHAKRM